MHIDTITHRSRICILHITSIFFNAQELIGALGVTTYVFIIGKKTMLWIGMSIYKTNENNSLIRRTFDLLFTKTIRPWSIDKTIAQNTIQHEILI